LKLNKSNLDSLFKSILFPTVIIYFITVGFVFPQDCKLDFEGYIIDSDSNLPLEAAVVEVIGTNYNAISSENGYFNFKNLCDEIIRIKVSHINCPNFYAEINLKESRKKNFFLDHKTTTLDEVVLIDEKMDNLSTSAKSYSISEIEKDQYSGSGLSVLLETVSGVNILSTGSNIAKPVIHGMFGSRIGIIYNGIMLENQQWGQDHAPNVDLNAFEDIKLVKGASVLKYSGKNPGGVIILKSSLPIKIDSLYGKTILNVKSNGAGGSIVSAWVKTYENGTYLKTQGTVKKSGDLSAPRYNLSNTGMNENNLSFTFGKNNIGNNLKMFFSYFNTENGVLKSSHIGNIKDLLRAIEGDEPDVVNEFSYNINYPKQLNEHFTSSVDYTHIINDNKRLAFKYSWQRNNRKEYDLRIGDFKNIPSLDLNLSTHSVNSSYTWSNFSNEFINGIFFEVKDNYSTPGTGVKRLIPDYLNTNLGGYFISTLNLNEGLNFGFGLRYEYSSSDVYKYYRNSRWENKNYQDRLGKYVIKEVLSQKLIRKKVVFNTFSSNTGFVKEFAKKYSLSIQHNYTERAPNIAEMFSGGLHHSLASIEYGDPFLKKEKTHKLLVDFEKKNEKLYFRINPYLSYSKNYILAKPAGFEQTIRGAFPVWEYSPINSIFKGVDFDFIYQVKNSFKFKNSISWVEARDYHTKEHLVNIPSLVIKNEVQFSFGKFKKFYAKAGNKFVNKQNLFPNNNSTTSVVENGKKIDKIVDISTPPDGYNLLNLNFNWGPYNLNSSTFNFSLSINNVMDKAYRNYLNRLRFYSDEIGRNILFQIKIKH
jgi:iron complex outermembrane receptor protein